MYKTIVTHDHTSFDQEINDAEKSGFWVIAFAIHTDHITRGYSESDETAFVALLHKPDTVPVPHMTTEQYLAARTPMERLADTADEVLREEARQYGAGR